MKRDQAMTYCDGLASQRMRWGSLDCALVVADWCHHFRGFDPAAGFRGAYHSEDQAMQIVKAYGGFLALITYLARLYGLPETDRPEVGDIAVVELPHDRRIVAHLDCATAIASREQLWAVKTPTGLAVRRCNVLRAWRL